jgi:hypothetical protein
MSRDTNWNYFHLLSSETNAIRSVTYFLFLCDVLGTCLCVAAYPTSDTSLLYPGVGQVAGASSSRGMS